MRYPALILALISIIWGLTWVSIKLGAHSVPPLFFAGTRFVVAGVILAVIFYPRLQWASLCRAALKLSVVSIFLISFCYGPLYWGMAQTSSGLAAVINLSLVPIGLLLFGVLGKQEQLTVPNIAGVVIGTAGLIIMFLPELQNGQTANALGISAIVTGTLSACLGAVLTKRWLSDLSTQTISTTTSLLGGIGLLMWSFARETIGAHTLIALAEPTALISWLFLVVAGSLIAFTLYMHLIKVWGALRAGLYAFIAPIIALVAGNVMLDETMEPVQYLGAAIMFGAAALITGTRMKQAAPKTAATCTIPQQ
ncbi:MULTISPECIES: DMT family transporter [Kordiimonas]|jgi:drug/metabolite transporter (DMT)-like permease|uniref:DMT family transporter n=1 Tax=Kordiimonas TaxID=288021 RepID=UPI0025801F90|nr:EamA family transporter [Kordiimonas sp. UBA4487]